MNILPVFVNILNVHRLRECSQKMCTEKHSIYLCLYLFVYYVNNIYKKG
nr:MAG TPA: hypothetical protein [Caudoviricetes sp.]